MPMYVNNQSVTASFFGIVGNKLCSECDPGIQSAVINLQFDISQVN